MFDSHIHLDQFTDEQIETIFSNANLSGVIAVATDLASTQRLSHLKQKFPKIQFCAGFHPEQTLPTLEEKLQLFDWIESHQTDLIAIGEVGLPHYLKQERSDINYKEYIDLLEQFIQLSQKYGLPIVLHIVYDDTEIALALLKKYQIKKAHFHWYKASDEMIQQLLQTPYMVSCTPDILWNQKTRKIVQKFPLERIMVETDGPWQHEGFETTDIESQLMAVISEIAKIKNLSQENVFQRVMQNIREFYFDGR
ncbi:TatD family hydrolase [Otariodibacter oris]|uniref:TatD DNase family protein n=1 Tax=Otariodibacter oris TaxID=1032623 RepID=A0A420XIF5_9PAST|nr:TatD family hydrolase [Otariodibacter oris]QGM80952.1 deoxyribonuclease [Otariodibacter oris]RKR76870.1 TatD DNase family protein [Otariodibacter oris]